MTLQWQDETPYSAEFDDIYYSRSGGLNETRYVFLQHNQLPERWQTEPQFRIAETGFGTGLNFLAAWQEWRAHRPRAGQLCFESIEGAPLTVAELRQVHAKWPELAELSNKLLSAQLPEQAKLPDYLIWSEERISLRLHHCDVLDALERIPAETVDAWMLDGFSPARNPAMWSAEVCQEIARTTRHGGTFATYTAASRVRERLDASGFVIHKVKGFAHKRDMLHGRKP
jgi:tRNA 5-methylaminomethyl-2-thiouridine biosynthesis bifunctional protein